ncbi:cytochrome C [Vulcaniibacterium gelatinicum]|uniref:cytochrome C n=1 Tax=Vulcaniibacterium gelatinicum TaxID=2598725 RepID=UPI0011C866DA|nr:cytochrome C [Vulcaniibacterium gelatinicum]
MPVSRPVCLALALLALAGCRQATPTPAAAAKAPEAEDAGLVARGEYLVRIAGCNDCHTAGYLERAGDVPKAQWLTGSPMGFHGPWGTTYAANLRLKAAEMDEAAWLKYTGELHTRPMMPDFTLRAMAPQDRRAIYRLLRALGPAGTPAPAYLPPEQSPPKPYLQLVADPPPQPAPSAAGALVGGTPAQY